MCGEGSIDCVIKLVLLHAVQGLLESPGKPREISLRFNRHFPGEPGLASVYLRQRMMEVVLTTGAISRAKPQSNHHLQQTNYPVFYRPDALPVTQPTVSKH